MDRGSTTEALGPLSFMCYMWGEGGGCRSKDGLLYHVNLLSISVEPSPLVLEVEGSDGHVFQNMILSLDSSSACIA